MLDKQSIKSILVIKMRNIGDVLLTTPVFANLRRSYPDARICALVNSGTEEMLTGNPCINHVHVYNRAAKDAPLSQRVVQELSLLKTLRKERFDLVLNLTEGDRGALAALLSGAPLRIGVDSMGRGFFGKNRIFRHLIPPPTLEMHTVDHNLLMLETIGIPVVDKQVSFHFNESAQKTVATLLHQNGLAPGGYFHAHVTSRWMFKSMPVTTAALLLDMLMKMSGLPAVLTAAPEEKELNYLKQVVKACQVSPLDLSGMLSLKQMGALTCGASFFVGVDSAPMHIAAALDVPVLAIFGPSSVSCWGPWDNRLMKSPYRETRGIQLTGRHMALQSNRECVPCLRDGCDGSKKSDCLAFSPEELSTALRAFQDMLASQAKYPQNTAKPV